MKIDFNWVNQPDMPSLKLTRYCVSDKAIEFCEWLCIDLTNSFETILEIYEYVQKAKKGIESKWGGNLHSIFFSEKKILLKVWRYHEYEEEFEYHLTEFEQALMEWVMHMGYEIEWPDFS